MSTIEAKTRESPAIHRPERYRAPLLQASAFSAPIICHIIRNINPQLRRATQIGNGLPAAAVPPSRPSEILAGIAVRLSVASAADAAVSRFQPLLLA